MYVGLLRLLRARSAHFAKYAQLTFREEIQPNKSQSIIFQKKKKRHGEQYNDYLKASKKWKESTWWQASGSVNNI